jgi:hypothetical protein
MGGAVTLYAFMTRIEKTLLCVCKCTVIYKLMRGNHILVFWNVNTRQEVEKCPLKVVCRTGC